MQKSSLLIVFYEINARIEYILNIFMSKNREKKVRVEMNSRVFCGNVVKQRIMSHTEVCVLKNDERNWWCYSRGSAESHRLKQYHHVRLCKAYWILFMDSIRCWPRHYEKLRFFEFSGWSLVQGKCRWNLIRPEFPY